MGDSANYVVEFFIVDLSTDNSFKGVVMNEVIEEYWTCTKSINRLSYFILHIAGDTFYQVSQVRL